MKKNRRKTKSMPAPAEDDTGLAAYRCRFCSQLFLTSTTPPAPPSPPLNAWHTADCVRDVMGFGDFVAIVYSGHSGYPAPAGEDLRKGGAG